MKKSIIVVLIMVIPPVLFTASMFWVFWQDISKLEFDEEIRNPSKQIPFFGLMGLSSTQYNFEFSGRVRTDKIKDLLDENGQLMWNNSGLTVDDLDDYRGISYLSISSTIALLVASFVFWNGLIILIVSCSKTLFGLLNKLENQKLKKRKSEKELNYTISSETTAVDSDSS